MKDGLKVLSILAAIVAFIAAPMWFFSKEMKPKNGETVYGADQTSAHVSLIRLEDGTRCAVVVGLYKGGISCDWK